MEPKSIEFLFGNSIGWSDIREERGSEISSFIVYLFFGGVGGWAMNEREFHCSLSYTPNNCNCARLTTKRLYWLAQIQHSTSEPHNTVPSEIIETYCINSCSE